MTTWQTLITLGGIFHFGILIASALVPQVLDWRAQLRKLDPLSRQLIWVHGGFIVLIIIGFGVVSLLVASEVESGSLAVRAICGLVSVFWLARLAVQWTVFDAGPYLTRPLLRLGYHGLTVVFAYLGVVYGWAACASHTLP